MSEMTPELLEAQQAAKARLRSIHREGETFNERRVQEIVAASALGLSLRDIGFELRVSAQTVANWKKLAKPKDPQ